MRYELLDQNLPVEQGEKVTLMIGERPITGQIMAIRKVFRIINGNIDPEVELHIQ